MTYDSGDTKSQYTGNGSATAFPTDFAFQKNSHVKAVLTASGVDDPLVEDVDYTLAGAGLESGTFTFPRVGSARHVLAVGERLTIYLDPPIEQGRAFDNSFLDLNEVEAAFDLLTMCVGSLNEKLGRAVMYPVSALESEVGTPEEYLTQIQAGMAAAQASAGAANAARLLAEAAQEGAEAAAALVPDNAGTRLTALESSQSAQDTSISTLQRTARIINHALLGGM